MVVVRKYLGPLALQSFYQGLFSSPFQGDWAARITSWAKMGNAALAARLVTPTHTKVFARACYGIVAMYVGLR